MPGVRVVFWCRRPVGGHDLVRLPAEQVGTRGGHTLHGAGAQNVIEVGPLPTTVPEPALGVVIGIPGA